MKILLLVFLFVSTSNAAILQSDVDEWEAQKKAPAPRRYEEPAYEPPVVQQPMTVMCPNGVYVLEGPCVLCPDGTYVAKKCVRTPNGHYIGM